MKMELVWLESGFAYDNEYKVVHVLLTLIQQNQTMLKGFYYQHNGKVSIQFLTQQYVVLIYI